MDGAISLLFAGLAVLVAVAGLFMAAHGVEPAFRVAGWVFTLAGVGFCLELVRRNS